MPTSPAALVGLMIRPCFALADRSAAHGATRIAPDGADSGACTRAVTPPARPRSEARTFLRKNCEADFLTRSATIVCDGRGRDKETRLFERRLLPRSRLPGSVRSREAGAAGTSDAPPAATADPCLGPRPFFLSPGLCSGFSLGLFFHFFCSA